MAKKELQVSAIENGTVIDHIPADKLFDVINVLGITGMDNAMTFGANLKSSKLGKKAIIKIWDKFLEDDEVNKLALVFTVIVLSIKMARAPLYVSIGNQSLGYNR